jgi:uncharacterized membrane protein
MDGWIALALLVLIGVPVGIIILLVGQSGLRRRIGLLEAEVARLSLAPKPEFHATKPAAPAMAPAAAPQVPPPPGVTEPGPEPVPVLTDTATPDMVAASTTSPDPVASGPWYGSSSPPKPGPAMGRPAPASSQDRPLAVSSERIDALMRWFQDNWVLAVAAVSLALAGVFFVQYGVERGLLPPPLRVLAAIGFGAALIAAGEWVRRRQGDAQGPTAYVPSTFSGAGIVSMFAGVLAARQMYGLIGPEMALFGLVAVALVALVLGWFYGPFLAAIGLVGATLAPFVVGGSTDDLTWFYAYFALIGALGLGIDTIRRWAWVSVLALGLSIAASGLLYLDGGQAGTFGVMLTFIVALAIIIPGRALIPLHTGMTTLGTLRTRGRGRWPGFPVRLAGGAMLAATCLMAVIETSSAGEGLVLLVCLLALSVAISLWAAKAPALADLAALPAIGFLARLVMDVVNRDPLSAEFLGAAISLRPPETSGPLTVTIILIMVAVMSLFAALRSLGGRDHKIAWAALSVLLPPIAMGVLEGLWRPASVIGAYPWALHAMLLAAGLVALATAFARTDGEKDRRRTAYATLSALVLIAFAFFAVLSSVGLTLALAALVVVATALDRRFRLAELGWFIQAGLLVLGWRLFLDPGLGFAFDAPLMSVVLSFLGAIAAMAAGLWLLRPLDRKAPKVFLESGLAAFAAVFADVLLFRWLDAAFPGWPSGHWAATLAALPWLAMALVQMYRARLGGFMARVRTALAAIAMGLAAIGLIAAVTVFNPLFNDDPVGGPFLLNTLFVAYALPGLVLIAAARGFRQMPRMLQHSFLWFGAALLALYVGLEIRHFWQGQILSNPGTTQGELYTYTLALMLTGAGLLYQAIASRSALLRRVGMTVIALTIAKVFLIDISGLTGLVRVMAFLGLGLSLAGLAWLNRWAAERSGQAG